MSAKSKHPALSPDIPPLRVAIIGGGISGIACSWKLRQHDCVVDIYEADDRLGGHAHSVPFKGNGHKVDVDTGFIALEENTYPQFSAFLNELGVETIPTDMSFGVSALDGAFEWGSRSATSFIGKLSLLLSPWFWRLVFDMFRFSLFARDALDEQQESTCLDITDQQAEGNAQPAERDQDAAHVESIGAYLRAHRYSQQFIDYYLIPMVAAPWCIDPQEFAETFPAKLLIQFMSAHGLLDTVTRTLRWRSFKNGSKTYVEAFQRNLPARHQLHLNTPVRRVARGDTGTTVYFSEHSQTHQKSYDYVVLAVHANQARRILGDEATPQERQILGGFKTSKNICYLHSDLSFLPKRRSARMAWNCFLGGPNYHTALEKPLLEKDGSQRSSDYSRICLTFDMNKLQSIPPPGEPGSPGHVLVSMNPFRIPQSPQSSHVYYHPLITAESIQMAARLQTIQNKSAVIFAGAWMGFGFHEDGFAAGARAAGLLTLGQGRGDHDGARLISDRVMMGQARQELNERAELRGIRKTVKFGIHMVQVLIELWENSQNSSNQQ